MSNQRTPNSLQPPSQALGAVHESHEAPLAGAGGSLEPASIATAPEASPTPQQRLRRVGRLQAAATLMLLTRGVASCLESDEVKRARELRDQAAETRRQADEAGERLKATQDALDKELKRSQN